MPAALLAVELLVCEFRVRFVMKGGQVVRRNAPDVRMREVAVMSLSGDSGRITGNASHIGLWNGCGANPLPRKGVSDLRPNTTNQD